MPSFRTLQHAAGALTTALTLGMASPCSLADTGPAAAPTFTSLAIFGDSLSDSGNNSVLLGNGGAVPTSNLSIPSGAPYASGTYSNGPVWVSSFAAGLGLPSAGTASLKGGSDYAFGGARVNSNPTPSPSATTQVNSFLSTVTTLPSTGLYIIAIGGNDVRDTAQAAAALLPAAAQALILANAGAYATAVSSLVTNLEAKGAQHIVVWNTPDVGKTPAALTLGSGFSGLGTNTALAFNQALGIQLAGKTGVSIFDVFSFVDGIVANPAAYGLTDVTNACGAGVNACSSNLNTALFYDGIHPTAAANLLLANAMLAAVPEPGSWLMLALGLKALAFRTWRRRRAG